MKLFSSNSNLSWQISALKPQKKNFQIQSTMPFILKSLQHFSNLHQLYTFSLELASIVSVLRISSPVIFNKHIILMGTYFILVNKLQLKQKLQDLIQ